MSERKSILGSLKSLVIEESPTSEQPAAVSSAKATIPAAQPIQAHVAFQTTNQIDPEVRKILEHDIQEAAKPAYSEFGIINASMEKIIADEKMRFQAVMASLAPRGLSVEQVITDIDECLSALDKKANETSASAETARKSRIGSKEQEAQSIVKQIDDLNKQITGLQLKHDSILEQITADTKEIDETENKLATAIQTYKSELISKRAKISSILGQGK